MSGAAFREREAAFASALPDHRIDVGVRVVAESIFGGLHQSAVSSRTTGGLNMLSERQ
jgi:hypothetical protein